MVGPDDLPYLGLMMGAAAARQPFSTSNTGPGLWMSPQRQTPSRRPGSRSKNPANTMNRKNPKSLAYVGTWSARLEMQKREGTKRADESTDA